MRVSAHQRQKFGEYRAERELFGDNDAVVFFSRLDVAIVQQNEIFGIKANETSFLLYGMRKLRIVGQPDSLQGLGVDSIEASSCQRLAQTGVNILIQKQPDIHLPVPVNFGCARASFCQRSISACLLRSWSISVW